MTKSYDDLSLYKKNNVEGSKWLVRSFSWYISALCGYQNASLIKLHQTQTAKMNTSRI